MATRLFIMQVTPNIRLVDGDVVITHPGFVPFKRDDAGGVDGFPRPTELVMSKVRLGTSLVAKYSPSRL